MENTAASEPHRRVPARQHRCQSNGLESQLAAIKKSLGTDPDRVYSDEWSATDLSAIAAAWTESVPVDYAVAILGAAS